MNAVATISAPITVSAIIQIVADFYGITPNDILSQRRETAITWPRQVVMFIAKKDTLMSLPDIGRRLGGRDHTTILHGVRRVEKAISEKPEAAHEIEAIRLLVDAEQRARLHFGLEPVPDIDPVVVAERILSVARGEFSASASEIIALARFVSVQSKPRKPIVMDAALLAGMHRLLASIEAFTRSAAAAAGARNGEERILAGEARNRAFAELLQATTEIRKEFPDATAG